MKKTIFLTAFLLSLLSMTGCQPQEIEEPAMGAATVKIEQLPLTEEGSLSVQLIPSENTVSITYALAEGENSYDLFKTGALSTTTTSEGNQPVTATFDGLVSGIHTVYAQAYDDKGKGGQISVSRVVLPLNIFKAKIQYVTHESAGFEFTLPGIYHSFRSAFGKREDREAFEKDEMEGIEYHVEKTALWKNYFDLEPDTEYVMFSQAYDLMGVPGDIQETVIRTFKVGECPAVTFEILSQDAYRGLYRLNPNELTGMIGAGLMDRNEYDEVINSGFRGNVMLMIDGWKESNTMVPSYKAIGKPLEMEEFSPEMPVDIMKEVYVTVYDKEFNITGVQHFLFPTVKFDKNAEAAQVEIEVSEITPHGAKYSYTKSENTLGVLYETIEADWFDEFRNSDTYTEYYMHTYLMTNGYWSYGNEPFEYVESKGVPKFRYYACACPMNGNGPREGGWSPIVLKEYTTITK